MARDVVEPPAGREVAFHVGEEAAEHVGAGRHRVGGAEEAAVDRGEQIGVLVGGTAEHDAVDVGEVRLGLSRLVMPPLMTTVRSGRAALRRYTRA